MNSSRFAFSADSGGTPALARVPIAFLGGSGWCDSLGSETFRSGLAFCYPECPTCPTLATSRAPKPAASSRCSARPDSGDLSFEVQISVRLEGLPASFPSRLQAAKFPKGSLLKEATVAARRRSSWLRDALRDKATTGV